MLKWKVNVVEELAKRGYNSTKFKEMKLMGQASFTKLKKGDTNVTAETLNSLCIMLKCQPGDLLECVPTDAEKIKYF